MDSNAINDAAPTGTNAGRGPARAPAQKVLDFLKTQAFYLAVVILVVVMGGLKTWKEFRAQEEQRRTGQPQENAGPIPLLQNDFDKQMKVCLDMALSHPEGRYRRAAAFAEAVESLKKMPSRTDEPTRLALTCAAVALLVMGLSWAARGRIAARPNLPETPWGLWDVCKLAALWAAGAQLLHTKLFFPWNPERPFAVPGDWIAEIFIGILLAGAMIHIVVAERGGHLRDLGLRGQFFGGIGLGLAAFLVVQPFLRLVAVLEERAAQNRWIPEIPVQQIIEVILKTRSGWVLALGAIVAIGVAPVSEEMLFRGFLQPALGHWTGRWWAIVLSAAFFAVAHMDLYAMPMLFVLGIALAYLYDRTRSLAAPVALHMLFNGMTLLSVFAFRGLVTVLRAPH